MTQPIAAPRFWYEIIKEGSFCDICKRDISYRSVCFHDFCPYILGHRGEAEVNKLTKQHEQELSETLDALDKQSALEQDAEEFENAEDVANAKLIAAAPDLLAAIEAMRVAGGAAEFQAAFDKAKKLAMEHNTNVTGLAPAQETR